MITATEIKKKAERKYHDYLRGIVMCAPFEPIVIPCDKKASTTMPEYHRELNNIRSLSKEVKGYGYTIEWKTINTKALGTQDFPDRILFETETDFARFLRKEEEIIRFRQDSVFLLDEFPVLKDWVAKYPMKVVDNNGKWNDLLKVLRYFSVNPNPNLYIRELPIEVHTKFIESNKTILQELLDIVIAEHVCTNEKNFENRFNLRFAEPEIRLRVLDKYLAESSFAGIDDLAVPVSQFYRLSLACSKVFVVENKVNFLTFPSVEGSIVIWGHGYGVVSLKDSELLRASELYYWGDFDIQGFEILSQFRGYFPQTKSFLMDRITFDKYFENDLGVLNNVSVELNLTDEERTLYEYLKLNNYRLEQEKIPQQYVLEQTFCLIRE